jgi:transposase
MRPKGTAEALEARRLVAARLFDLGKTNPEVAEACGVSLSAVKQWKRRWKEGGAEALAARPHPGPCPRLSPAQLRKLLDILRRGAEKSGFGTDLWTCSRVARVIRRRFEVQYHPCHVWKVLRKLGWTCQKPERRARERDEAAIERWRKVTWPRIKKRATAKC